MKLSDIAVQNGAREPEGPLAPYFDLFAGLLQDQGYSQTYSARQTWLVADFSRWLREADLALKEKILAKITPADGMPGVYKPDDQLMAFLNNL